MIVIDTFDLLKLKFLSFLDIEVKSTETIGMGDSG
jgi:hypothetical protein